MGIDVSQLIWDSGLSIVEVARRCGQDDAYINRLIHGKLPLTKAMALKIEAAAGIPRLAAIMMGFDPIPGPHGSDSLEAAS